MLIPYCAAGPGPHLVQKAADVIAEVAKREWPQRWPSFHRTLISTAGRGGPHAAQVAVAVLANLSEDCTSVEYQMQLPAKRRAQVASVPLMRGIATYTVFLSPQAERSARVASFDRYGTDFGLCTRS